MGVVTWDIPNRLARASRPGYNGLPEIIPEPIVKMWCNSVADAGIRSILCLLAPEHLKLYAGVPGGLLDYYRTRGFEVGHVPVADHKWPPLDDAELHEAWKTFQTLPGPVLVHCSAGVERTGAAVEYIRAKLDAEELPHNEADS